jgi:hypothetical protein
VTCNESTNFAYAYKYAFSLTAMASAMLVTENASPSVSDLPLFTCLSCSIGFKLAEEQSVLSFYFLINF